MSAANVRIRATTEEDWQQVRDLRIEMIRDTPLAFGETLESALANSEATWRLRGARGTSGAGTFVVAIDETTGRWVGTMGGFIENGHAMLVGVYVSPSHRGRRNGVAEALLAEVEHWARAIGSTLRLHVHEANPRARAFYQRLGFVETGQLYPYVLDRSANELEMIKRL